MCIMPKMIRMTKKTVEFSKIILIFFEKEFIIIATEIESENNY